MGAIRPLTLILGSRDRPARRLPHAGERAAREQPFDFARADDRRSLICPLVARAADANLLKMKTFSAPFTGACKDENSEKITKFRRVAKRPSSMRPYRANVCRRSDPKALLGRAGQAHRLDEVSHQESRTPRWPGIFDQMSRTGAHVAWNCIDGISQARRPDRHHLGGWRSLAVQAHHTAACMTRFRWQHPAHPHVKEGRTGHHLSA